MPHRFHHRGQWHLADEAGIRTVSAREVLAIATAQPLDFDSAINLSREYFSQADEAEDIGDAEAEERWSTWAEQLEIWAAAYYPAPGRVICGMDRASQPDRTVRFYVRRTAVHACEQQPSFAEMTRR